MKNIFGFAFLSISMSLLVYACAPAPAATEAVSAPNRVPQETIVSLTFDDGDADNFNIEPLLKANGLHATFYVSSGLVGNKGYMTWDQLETLQRDGNEIGGHTLTHTKVEGLDSETLKRQICDDRQNLIARGFNPISFAYPYGNYDPQAQQMVRDCGYTSGRTVKGPALIPPPDPYALGATPYIVYDTTLAKLKRYISETRKEGGGWQLLIFHHVCDGCDFFSVKPDVMDQFIPWLAEQQSKGNLKVMTIGEVIGARAP